MWFRINLDEITLQLQIKSYEKSCQEEWHGQWCETDFSFSSEPWLNYHKEADEVLLSCEVEQLADSIDMLLRDELSELIEIAFVEPDFHFILHPKKDLRNDPRYACIAPGCEIKDIYMEWAISFWNEGLTSNFLSVRFNRPDLECFRAYLFYIIGRQSSQSAEFLKMKNNGMIFEK